MCSNFDQNGSLDLLKERSVRPEHFLPPNLPHLPPDRNCLPDDHVLAGLPCTRYWHMEKRLIENGLPPPGVPHWLQRFDWLVGWEHGWAQANSFPRHVFCHPDAATELLDFLKENFRERNSNSFLAIGGGDRLLSRQNCDIIQGLKRYFSDIFYEAFDCLIPSLKMMPIGLTEFYVRGFEEHLRKAIGSNSQKTLLALSTFGKFFPRLNEAIPDRKNALEFASRSDFVTSGPFSQPDYYDALSSHHYMVCPRGNGVQAPKILEAFLFGCIPIMTDSLMARTYAHKGAPVLVVKNWSDVTRELLEKNLPELRDKADSFAHVASNPSRWWEFSFSRNQP